MGAGGSSCLCSNSSRSTSNPIVFFVVTEREMIGIDVKKLLVQPEWSTTIVPNEAPIYVKMNLVNSFNGKTIVGMKHVTLDSDVYLLGGECLASGVYPDKQIVSKHPNSYLGSSNRVLKLSFEKKEFKLKRTSRMKFLYGKCRPMVENISGKIYVLEDMPHFQKHHLNCPFEVYDLEEEYSTPLSNPPPYARYPQGKIEGHVVLGDKFIVFEKKSDEEIDGYFYDTHTACGWKKLDPFIVFLFTHGCLLPLPINGMCVPFFPQLKHCGIELVISRRIIEEGHAMLINASTGALLFYQPLIEFQGRYPKTNDGDRMYLSKERNFFFMLPDNKICVVWIAFDHYRRLRIFVTTFSLELLFDPTIEPNLVGASPSQPRERTFLRISDLHNWDCVVACEPYLNHIFDAFFYGVHEIIRF